VTWSEIFFENFTKKIRKFLVKKNPLVYAANIHYDKVLSTAQKIGEDQLNLALRNLCKSDLFFLLTRGMGRKDMLDDWLLARCIEIQNDPDFHLDLWAREHYKSTIITFGLTIKDILNDPEITVGIFSHTKPIARAFLRQIKKELEDNLRLQFLFPDILYRHPRKESSNWSEDKGITVKRKTNPKEATIEAHGLVDGQPTSKHFSRLVYDDVVTRESVTTPEMIKKVTESWELSLNLGAEGGVKRYIGTRYHFNDTYRSMMDRGSAIPRIHPATHDGTISRKPVFLTQESLDNKRRDQGSYVFACQQLQNPKADSVQGFHKEDMRFYKKTPDNKDLNIYMLVDPANDKKKKSDYTALWVIGLAQDQNYYVLHFTRKRLGLTERADLVFEMHKKYKPIVTGYEEYGIQGDIQHIQYVQDQENYRFDIIPLGGSMGKNERIRKLVPVYENHRMWFPEKLDTIEDNRTVDLVSIFINDELEPFPVCAHDDMLDSQARILDPDLNAKFPIDVPVHIRKKRHPTPAW
jgi:predicted phage terminase large subunit-like protein